MKSFAPIFYESKNKRPNCFLWSHHPGAGHIVWRTSCADVLHQFAAGNLGVSKKVEDIAPEPLDLSVKLIKLGLQAAGQQEQQTTTNRRIHNEHS